MQTYQANQDIRVLFVISIELKRSLKSPCLCVELASFCSSSPSGISFRLNAATFLSSSMASLGLPWARSQRGDSGINLRLKNVSHQTAQLGQTILQIIKSLTPVVTPPERLVYAGNTKRLEVFHACSVQYFNQTAFCQVVLTQFAGNHFYTG